MKWVKDQLRKKLDERAREQYMASGSFASTLFGLDGIPFVRRDAIIDFILSLADESPIKEDGEDLQPAEIEKYFSDKKEMDEYGWTGHFSVTAKDILDFIIHITKKSNTND